MKLCQLSYYRPQRSCGKVMFLHLSVSHSVHRVGLCPSMHHRSHDQGGLCPGGSLSGGCLSMGVSVQGSFCLGGSLSRGVSVLGSLRLGGSLSKGSLLGRPLLR